MRLNRFISLCGQASRRGADKIIAAGRITINGELVKDFSYRVQTGDVVKLDGKTIAAPTQYTYLMLHKPVGCLSTAKDPRGRPTIYKYLPRDCKKMRYIGRLDFNSRGLLLLTDHGELLHRLTHPSYQVPRTYHVWTHEPMTLAHKKLILQGVDIGEGQSSRPTKIKFSGLKSEITLTEGKNREIRRLMAAVGLEVTDLKRVSYAGLDLEPLGDGKFRFLTHTEIGQLYAMAKM
ncbi:MAG: rRNA pseudouridine synthase [Fibrobacter sp.]|nr:rRNA pseudouridine synthase [Fibrobacter sp.]